MLYKLLADCDLFLFWGTVSTISLDAVCEWLCRGWDLFWFVVDMLRLFALGCIFWDDIKGFLYEFTFDNWWWEFIPKLKAPVD